MVYFCTIPTASDYKLGDVDPNEQYHDTKAESGVGQAVWMLVLAMLAKAVLTIFTFGIKVRPLSRVFSVLYHSMALLMFRKSEMQTC